MPMSASARTASMYQTFQAKRIFDMTGHDRAILAFKAQL